MTDALKSADVQKFFVDAKTFEDYDLYVAPVEETDDAEAVDEVHGYQITFEGKKVKEHIHGDGLGTRICNWFKAVGQWLISLMTCGKFYKDASNPGMFWSKRDVSLYTAKVAHSEAPLNPEELLAMAAKAIGIEKFTEAPEAEEADEEEEAEAEEAKSPLETNSEAMAKALSKTLDDIKGEKKIPTSQLADASITVRKVDGKVQEALISLVVNGDKGAKTTDAKDLFTYTLKA